MWASYWLSVTGAGRRVYAPSPGLAKRERPRLCEAVVRLGRPAQCVVWAVWTLKLRAWRETHSSASSVWLHRSHLRRRAPESGVRYGLSCGSPGPEPLAGPSSRSS